MSTSDSRPEAIGEQVSLPVETPVTIDLDGVDSYTLLCTPADLVALGAGFLFSEGVVDDLGEIATIRACSDDPHVIRVRLAGVAPRIDEPGRSLVITSSCGLCGAQDLGRRLAALPVVPDTLRIDSRLLPQLSSALARRQELFRACGGTHAAAIFAADGTLVEHAEDIGRHNALDKAIGKCLLRGVPTAGHGVALSGRPSLELIAKCARAGIELVSAVSAPTSLAVETAARSGITLCAFVRDTRATLFTQPHRVRLG